MMINLVPLLPPCFTQVAASIEYIKQAQDYEQELQEKMVIAQNGECPDCPDPALDFDEISASITESMKAQNPTMDGGLGALGYFGPGGAAKGIQAGSKWAVKMLKKYPNANLGIKQIGEYMKYTVNVPGKNGYTIYTKYINAQGKTMKWFHDTYNSSGKFLHRGWTEGATKVHQWWDGFIQTVGPYIPR